MIDIPVMLDPGAYMPYKAYADDAGFDLMTPERVVLRSHDSAVIDTGVHVQIPSGYVGMLKSKSGLNVNHDITGEGVIDAGYTGSIKAKLYNSGGKMHIFERGDKIIQLCIVPIFTGDIRLVDGLEETDRGENGLGSSGR